MYVERAIVTDVVRKKEKGTAVEKRWGERYED